MSASPYEEVEPRAELRPWVRRLWRYGPCPPEAEPQPIPPDGCPELIIHLGAPYAELDEGRLTTQPRIVFAGQLTRPLVLAGTGPTEVIAVRFEPDGACGFLGGPATMATDRRLDMTEQHGDLHDLIAAAPDRFAALQDWLAPRLGPTPDPVARAMVRALEAGEGTETAALSERQAQRRFKAAVGVSPRQFAQILRFRRVFDAIDRPAPGWVEAALAAGYFDQPQMARDFRRYLGCTATQWARRSLGLADHVAGTASETYKRKGEATG